MYVYKEGSMARADTPRWVVDVPKLVLSSFPRRAVWGGGIFGEGGSGDGMINYV